MAKKPVSVTTKAVKQKSYKIEDAVSAAIGRLISEEKLDAAVTKLEPKIVGMLESRILKSVEEALDDEYMFNEAIAESIGDAAYDIGKNVAKRLAEALKDATLQIPTSIRAAKKRKSK